MTYSEEHQRCGQWRLSATELRALMIAFLAGLVARAGALQFTVSIDDIVCLTYPEAWDVLWTNLISNGRFAGAILLGTLHALGLGQPHANALGVLLGTMSLALAGIIACRVWRLPGGAAPAAIAACLISNHPYHADVAAFRVTYLLVCLSFLLAAAAVFLLLETRVAIATPVVVLALAYAMYQTSITYALMMLTGAWWMNLVTASDQPSRGLTVLRRGGIAVIASLPLYFLASAAALAITGVKATARMSTIALAQFTERAVNILGLLRKLAVEAEPIVPLAVKLLLLSLLAASILAVAFRQVRAGGVGRGLLSASIALTVVCLLNLLMVGPFFVVVEWWPAPRALSQIGVFWGLVFAAAYSASNGRGRPALLCIGGLAAACFVGLINQVFLDQHRMNTRDMLRSNRIVSRLEAQPDFASVKELAIIGGPWAYPMPLATTYYDMNVSALYPPWSSVAAISEVSGYKFARTSDAGKLASAKGYCAAVAPWPAETAVTVQGEVGVVCLGRP